jgi:hypothetical protein
LTSSLEMGQAKVKAIIQRKKDYKVAYESNLVDLGEAVQKQRKRARQEMPSDTEAPTPPKNKNKKKGKQQSKASRSSTPDLRAQESQDQQVVVAPKVSSSGISSFFKLSKM